MKNLFGDAKKNNNNIDVCNDSQILLNKMSPNLRYTISNTMKSIRNCLLIK